MSEAEITPVEPGVGTYAPEPMADDTPRVEAHRKYSRRFSRASIVGTALVLLLPGGLVAGAVRHYQAGQDAAATAKQRREFVPNVRVAQIRPSDGIMTVSLPATTTA